MSGSKPNFKKKIIVLSFTIFTLFLSLLLFSELLSPYSSINKIKEKIIPAVCAQTNEIKASTLDSGTIPVQTAHASTEATPHSEPAHSDSAHHGASYKVPPLLIIPFAALLLAIAVMPFINKHFWERNYPYISYALGVFVVFYYIFVLGATGKVWHTLLEYISFIALIGSLFVRYRRHSYKTQK